MKGRLFRWSAGLFMLAAAPSAMAEDGYDLWLRYARADQARAGAIDELLASGALTDATGTGKDSLTLELERMASEQDVNAQLEALKSEVGTSAPKPEIEG